MTGLIPLVFIFKRKVNIELIIYLSLSIVASAIIFYTSRFRINNHWVFNSYIFISYWMLFIFYLKLVKGKFQSQILKLSSIIFAIIFSWELSKTSNLTSSLVAWNLSFLIWSILYFLTVTLNQETDKRSLTYNYFNLSIFIYNCSCLLLFYYIDFIMVNKLWYIHNFIEGSSKLLIAYAFWKLPKTSQF